jgi:hypothetical protein
LAAFPAFRLATLARLAACISFVNEGIII